MNGVLKSSVLEQNHQATEMLQFHHGQQNGPVASTQVETT
jgi:hypothetical protein